MSDIEIELFIKFLRTHNCLAEFVANRKTVYESLLEYLSRITPCNVIVCAFEWHTDNITDWHSVNREWQIALRSWQYVRTDRTNGDKRVSP